MEGDSVPVHRGQRPYQLNAIAALTLLAAASSTMLLVGCGATSTTPTSTATAVADLSPLVVTACLDRTRSFDRHYFNDAKNLLADAVLRRATTKGQAGATIYVTLIGRNSYAPNATARTIVVPPTPRSTMSSSSSNVFNSGAAKETATAAAAVAASATTRIAQQLQPDISFLRSFNPTIDSSTDILGCVSRASERFQAAPSGAQKLLLLATDLQAAGAQQVDKSRPLGGVKVKVIDWKCDDAQTCDTLKNSWRDEFVTKDQAASVSYYDPAETQAQVAGHLFDGGA